MNNCKRHHSEIYNIEDMTKSPSPKSSTQSLRPAKKLTPFHVRTKDLKKDTATIFIRIHTCKVDVLISTMLQVEVADWQKATASPAHGWHIRRRIISYKPNLRKLRASSRLILLR